jgi:hypothetical protein
MAKIFFALLLIVVSVCTKAQNVGIGTTTPDTSAIVEMKSTNKGILIPRITEAARLQISDPAPGLLVFQSNNTVTSLKGFYYFDGSNDEWYRIGTSNQIGIGTEKPHPKAILDIKSTSQGVLFPTLNNIQRDAISNPPNGLHIFNAEEKCLNFYDSINKIWDCYCTECKTKVINITTNKSDLDFYQLVKDNPYTKYLVNISAGVTISSSTNGGDAFIFSTMTFPALITIVNYGTIAGAGGRGRRGYFEPLGICGTGFLTNINNGGSAILTKPGVIITLKNYGIVAGGGGGGMSGSNSATGYGGGGGGGAGTIIGSGGSGGGYYTLDVGIGGTNCIPNSLGMSGTSGTAITGGVGGVGVNGGTDGKAGGARGAAGVGIGAGTAGKAIEGGSGNSIINFGTGQYFGVID